MNEGVRALRVTAVVLFALIVGHDISHIADPGLDTPLGALAIISVPQYVGLIWILNAVLRSPPRRSAGAGLALGLAVLAGFVVAHLLPFGPAPFYDEHPAFASWLLLWLPIGTCLLLIALSLSVLRRTRAAAAVAVAQ